MSEGVQRNRPAHLSILASAGAGKTYQLTSRYLALLAGGAPPGSILATTFTRLAAGEIRDRILMRLADAAEDDEKRKDLAGDIGAGRLDRAHVTALLRLVAKNLHRLQIRTLDSFFASVVRSFAIELGIPPGSDVLDEEESSRMRSEAIRRMLDERDPQRLIELLRLLTQGTSERSVMSIIDRTVAALHELFREAPPEVWERLPRRPELSPVALVEAVQRLEETPPDDKRQSTAQAGDCTRARARDWEDFLDRGLVKPIADGRCAYYKKPIEDEVVAAYQPLIEHAVAVLVNRVGDQTMAMRDLLALFGEHQRAVKRRLRAVTFRDITASMIEAQAMGRFDEICFRIDATIRHLLLDEFQDTSIQQWRALEPIGRELVNDETRDRSFFCVGDPKQSIYGWRDACPEVLDELGSLLVAADGRSAIGQIRLARSYRSSPVVIDVVNRVFASLGENGALDEFPDAVERFAGGFEPHETARRQLPGYAELRTVRRAGEGEKTEWVRLSAAAKLVKMLHEEAPGLRIGVLTRTNRAVARLLYEFSESRLNVPASGRGGGSLTDAPAVNAVLDLLRLADHPDDTAAAFHVAHGPLGRVIEFTDEQAAPHRRRIARRVRRMLLEDGYASAIASWTRLLGPACDERQYRRLMQLVELAGEYEGRATLRADDFVRFIEERTIAETRPAPVEVMTIHQAKGLEFDIVILPDLEGKLTGGHPPVVVERDGSVGPITRICPWVKREVRALLEEIEPMFARQRTRAVRESLCVLYVAMTRARQGLYMLVDPPGLLKNGSPSPTIPRTAAGVLRCALTDGEPPEPDALLYSHGDQRWIAGRRSKPPGKEAPRVRPVTIRLGGPAAALTRGVAAPPASALAARDAALGDRLRLTDDEPRDHGTAMHRLFEQIEWIEEFQADEAHLMRLVRQTAPRRGQAWAREIVDRFLAALRREEIRRALSRAGADVRRLRVRREQPFARLVGGRVQSGYIDRIVIELDNEGRPVCGRVIDFKTDAIEADEAAEHAETYRGQLASYRAAAARLLNLDESAVRMTVLFVRCGIAVDLAGA